MASHGGKRQNAGRKIGSQNKFTANVKEALQLAYQQIGGDEALAKWAKANQTEFYKLYGKLIPTTLANDKDNPISVPGLQIVMDESTDTAKTPR